jgi:ubiquinone/menaquinone biosynthesis C-methylase UbiE
VRRDVLELIPPGTSSLLDVGCGEGASGRAAKDEYGIGFVAGIEHFAPAADRAREALDEVIQMDIETAELPFDDGRFDCIVCADILEHLRDPWAALVKLRRVLRRDGVLIASIPNLANLRIVKLIVGDRFDYESSGTLDRTHLRFFTLNTIRSMFAEAGFEIVGIERKMRRGFFGRHARFWSLGYIREGGVSKFTVVARAKNGSDGRRS